MNDLGFNQHLKDLGVNSVNDLFKRNIPSNIREMTPQEAKTKRNKKIRNKLAKLSKKRNRK